MYKNEIIKIIQYLTLFELDVNTTITDEIINREYRRLAKIYHPDVANSRYKDGKKFIELQEARDYLLSNINTINKLIINGFSTNGNSYQSEQMRRAEAERKNAEEERRRKEEAIRRATEEEQRRREENERRRAEEERRRREEAIKRAAEEKERVTKEKNNIQYELKKLLNGLEKDEYYEKEYEYILNLAYEFVSKLPEMQDYKSEYEVLIKTIKRVKTKKYFKNLKKIKKYIIISSACLVCSIIFAILLIQCIIPSIKYNEALKYIEENDLNSAYDILDNLDYKDSETLANELALLSDLKKEISCIELFSLEKVEDIIIMLVNKKYNIIFEYDNDKYTLGNEYIIKGYYKNANKDGYSFKTWKLVDTCYNVAEKSVKFKLGGIFEKNDYSIKYNLNNGYFKENVPTGYSIDSNDIHIPNPVRDGYIFIGWTAANLVKPSSNVTIKSGSFGDVVFTANWQAIEYKISFNSNGGNNIEEIRLNYNELFTLPDCYKNGYEFLGWYMGNTKILRTGQFKFLDNITLTAQWRIIQYKLIYNLSGGTASNPSEYNINTDTFTLNNPQRRGYRFLGWRDNGGSISKTLTIKRGTIGNKTLTAFWEPIEYKISYFLDSSINNSKNPEVYTIEDSVILYAPSKNGYLFEGWYSENNFLKKVNSIGTGTCGDIKLYAKFSPKRYNIIVEQRSFNVNFYMNDDSSVVYQTQIITVSQGITYPTLPERNGYCFTGWYTEKECVNFYDFSKKINMDTNLYAGWVSVPNCIVRDGRNLSILFDNYYTSWSRTGITYAFCSLVGGKIVINFENDSDYERTITIINKTKNITVYDKKIDWFDGMQKVVLDTNPGDIITVYSFSLFITTDTNVTVSGITTPTSGGKAYDTYSKIGVYYNDEFYITPRSIKGYKFKGYRNQYGRMVTDLNGKSTGVFNYDYDLYLTEVWEKE